MRTLIALSACLILTPMAARAQVEGRQILRERAAGADASSALLGARLWQRAMGAQAEERLPDTLNPRRVHRAQEAAELINKGDCDGARGLARAANDTRLLAGVERACAPQAATPPAAAPTPASQ